MLAACTIHASYTGDSRQCRKLTMKAASQQEPFIQQHFFSLFSTDLILAEGNSSSVSINQGTTFITGPYLDGSGLCNVTSQISTHAYLPCRVSLKSFFCFFPLIESFIGLCGSQCQCARLRKPSRDLGIEYEYDEQLIHQKSIRHAAKWVNVAACLNSLHRIGTFRQCL